MRGIAIVAQEVALVPGLTVAQNVFLGAEPRRAGFIDRRAHGRALRRLATTPASTSTAGAVVGGLPIAEQQQVEILRSLAREADLIVLDEPTASLSAKEIARLHEIVRTLRSSGRTVILVSHFLNEVLDLADTVTVLRDGRVIRTGPAAAETEASLVAAMLGRPAARAYPIKRPPPADSPVALSIRGVSRPGRPRRLPRRARRRDRRTGGVDRGRSDGAGAGHLRGGAALGRRGDASAPPGSARSPAASLQAGLAMIPESRKDDGLFLGRPIRENVSLSNLGDVARFGFVRRGAERTAGRRARSRRSPARRSSTRRPAPCRAATSRSCCSRGRCSSSRACSSPTSRPAAWTSARSRTCTSCSSDSRPTAWPSCSSRTRWRRSSASPTGSLVMRQGRLVAELVGEAMTEERHPRGGVRRRRRRTAA